MARRLKSCSSIRRALLLPPIALSIFLFIWTVSGLVPFSASRVCVLGHRTAIYCVPRDEKGMEQVSSGVAEMQIGTFPLKLEVSKGGGALSKPLRDVKSIESHQQSDEVVEGIKEVAGRDDEPYKFQNNHASNELAIQVKNSRRLILTKSPDEIAVDEVTKIMDNLRRSSLARANLSEAYSSALDGGRGRNASCEGRRAYIYDLPSKFNTHLVTKCDQIIPWYSMCNYFLNSGMGKMIEAQEGSEQAPQVLVPAERWYETHQYSLELLFHARLKENPCLVTSPEEANVFFVPYYGGLDVLRWHFFGNASAAQRDALGLELIRWLQEQPWWRRNDGIDHVLVLGKVSWDFRRTAGRDWGNSLLQQPEMQQLTKILIERQPWHPNDVGVPHPTFFHPRTADDVRIWQGHIDGARRQHLVSFAGKPRPKQTESIRAHLIRQCLSRSPSCFFLRCTNNICLQPNTTMSLFTESEFCLQPPGDSPTRRSIFDSLIAGCIPVLFDPYSAYFQYPWHLPANSRLYSVYISAQDVREGKVNVVEELEKIPKVARQEMRQRIIYEIMPGLVYSMPGAMLIDVEDAFDISLRSLFMRVASRLEERKTHAIA